MTAVAVRARVRGGNQDPAELAQFLDLVRTLKARSYLEVGCRNGDTFDAVMRTIGEGGYGLAIDRPENSDSRRNLLATVADLDLAGISAEALLGDSQSSTVVNEAKSRAPFDLILIDADHRYEAVGRDFATYGGMAPVVALHDVTAPRGHMSDGHPNGVGVFWNEIKQGFRHQEFVTPGSQMGFGVIHRDVKEAAAGANDRCLVIAVPAWGSDYVELAVRFTLPSVLASLAARPVGALHPRFLIHTDDETPFRACLAGQDVRFVPVRVPRIPKQDPLPKGTWEAFKQSHRDAIAMTPKGSVVALLNSDIVVSRETFAAVDRILGAGVKKVIASVGIRTLIDGNTPPIGADAVTLNRWVWSHRHRITDDNIWGRGRSAHPTILYFEDGENVSLHGFHLTPMFMLKDRNMAFRGTIDDDVLQRYNENEIYFVRDLEMSFAELSPLFKRDNVGAPLSVDGVVKYWGARGVSAAHARNFRQRIRVLGNPAANHPAADQIIAGLR